MKQLESEEGGPGEKGATTDLLLVCSSGGHVLQLLALSDAWGDARRVWVSDDTSDVRSLLAGERLVLAHGPTARSIWSFVRNFALAWRLHGRTSPTVVLTTGAATAVPFAWVGRLRGAKVVYVESLSRIDEPSLSLRLIAPVVDRIYVQWPDLVRRVRRARYVGTVLADL